MTFIFEKCKKCKKRVKTILTSYDFDIGGEIVRVNNVPAFQCPICGEVYPNDLGYQKARRYAAESNDAVVDYAEREADADFVVTQFFM